MNTEAIIQKALHSEWISVDEACILFREMPLNELMALGHNVRMQHHKEQKVSWIIDRNVNITNVCSCACRFCNFHCAVNSEDAYVTTLEQYRKKITELFELGGDQLLLQGGLNPALGLTWYEDLFRTLKLEFPLLKLHALGPPEIAFLAKKENTDYETVLTRLMKAGLDSLPGAGAEILSDRVRKIVSPAKCSTKEWYDVMRAAHQLHMITSATMMFGHAETLEERMQHMADVRVVQNEKPAGAPGFIAFIAWPFQQKDTKLQKLHGTFNAVTEEEYLRMVAISRIMLPNVDNIQASWLTVGKEAAKKCLHAGANDLGSVMIEENVVSAAGAHFTMTPEEMVKTIGDAGFEAARRNQKYEFLN
ncbi:MAG: cyclic dehypoxanthinyl futalosine synthase [Bacteroidota bacterium]